VEWLLQPTHLFFIELPIFFLVRGLNRRADQGDVASRFQSQPSHEILLLLEKINSTLERIEHKLEPTRKAD
jgi:hypothetical protein